MIAPILPNGIQGLSDSLHSGVEGSCSKLVGIDYRTVPGTFQAHQKLSKHSSTTVTELCKNVVNCSDGSRLWFSSETGKIWREEAGTYTLVHTTAPTTGEAKCLGAIEYHGEIFWATELYVHKIFVEDLGDWTLVTQNWAKFVIGDDTFHPMVIQNLQLYIGDKTTIAKVDKPLVEPEPQRSMSVAFSPSSTFISHAGYLVPSGNRFPSLVTNNRSTSASATSVSHNLEVPNETNQVAIVYVSSVRTDSTPPASTSSVTFGGATITAFTTQNGNLGGTIRARVEVYRVVNPTAGTNTVTVNYGSAETNIVVKSFLFKNASSYSSQSFDINDTVQTSTSFPTVGQANTYYQLPFMFVNSSTTTQTVNSDQITIYNTNNTWGTDSSSYIRAIEPAIFTEKTEFNLVAPERIQTIADFDIDILVGTRNVNRGRVLRWDGVSEGWSAQDDIEEQGINAFIKDDNFIYAQAGMYGRMYFYNGEKLDPFKRIPGDWSPTKTAKINPNAVAFHLGVPVFGLTNVAGNPTLQGVYGFGSYGTGYPKTLSLDYPIPTNAFEGVEIGAIVSDGADLYVSYKDATDVGVAKLDWANKYNGAYLETTTLFSPKERSDFSTIDCMNADYTSLPANTNISFSYKKKYESSYVSLNAINFPKLQQVKARESITDIANLIVKISLTTTANASPNVENISLEL